MTVINPKKVIDQEIITKIENEETQLQQNGIDLTVLDIFHVKKGQGCILTEEKRVRPEGQKMELVNDPEYGEVYELKAWESYDVLFGQKVDIPSNMSGFIKQRSSLNRMCAFITTGWWDSWFKGYLGWIIRPALDIKVGKGTRLAQLILLDSDSAGMYNGIYKEK